MEQYIKVYEWLLRHTELNVMEAIIVSHIIRWDQKGCFQSNYELATLFKKHPRHLQRIIKSLVKRGWLAPLYPNKRTRILYATLKEPPIGPLFEYQERAKETIIERKAKIQIKRIKSMTKSLF